MAKQTFTTGQVLTAAQMTSLQETAMGGGPATAKTASYVLVAADAGTTVAMNAAGSTTITVNTGLFAAGDTVFIQNLGAGACTVTAGTATVATAGSLILPQNDAGILYFTATGAAIFYDYIQAGAVSPLTTKGDLYTFSTSDARLGVGANGTTLVADSAEATGLKWATASSGSMTLLSTTTLSGSATTVSSISASYKNLYILIVGVNCASASVIRLLPNSDGTLVDSGFTVAIKDISVTSSANWSDVFMIGADQTIKAGDTNNIFVVQIYDYANSSQFKLGDYTIGMVRSTTDKAVQAFGNGRIKTTSAISSIQVTSGTGNFSGGTMYIYGVN